VQPVEPVAMPSALVLQQLEAAVAVAGPSAVTVESVLVAVVVELVVVIVIIVMVSFGCRIGRR
jgi:hypothetical protein